MSDRGVWPERAGPVAGRGKRKDNACGGAGVPFLMRAATALADDPAFSTDATERDPACTPRCAPMASMTPSKARSGSPAVLCDSGGVELSLDGVEDEGESVVEFTRVGVVATAQQFGQRP